jgi:hypothetical protein
MQPFYWESAHGNFGDDLNLWLWDFLLPGFREVHSEILLVGVGTVLNRALLPQATRKLVVGSGFGYGTLPDFSDPAEWDIRCLRGPLTAAKLGLDFKLGIIDPAVMVADMPEFQNLPKTGRALFVPHWESTIGVDYRPRQVPISSRAEAVTKGARFWGVDFSGKLPHSGGSDAAGLAEIMTRRDPARSMLRSLGKQALAAPATLALRQARKAAPQLSADAVLAERKDRFRDVLDTIRRDYF